MDFPPVVVAASTIATATASAPTDSLSERLTAAFSVPRLAADSENALATYFDVAVVRCLFIAHWSEDGVFWALTYINKR